MKIIYFLALSLLVTSCGPNSTDSSGTQTTSKTTTTVTTTTPPEATAPVIPLTSLTQANLDRLQKDMSPAQVEAILGPPTSSQSQPIPIVGGTQTTYTYQNENSSVTIVFKNNLMMEKSGTFNP